MSTESVSEVSTYVAMDAPVKFVTLKVRNQSGRTRRVSLIGYWELVLGEWRHANLMNIVTDRDPDTAPSSLATRIRVMPARLVFAQVSEPRHTVTGNRTEFIGRNGSLADPAALHRTRLSGRPARRSIRAPRSRPRSALADGQEREVVFVVGAADDTDEARGLVMRFGGPAGARQGARGGVGALESRPWRGLRRDSRSRARRARQRLARLPDPLLPVLGPQRLLPVGRRLRLPGPAAGHAALLHSDPWLTREHLLRSAARQFHEGDVQHWWHPPGGQGVRTHSSDDYLWLPYATCLYVQATGDTGVLDEQVGFVEGRALGPEEEA